MVKLAFILGSTYCGSTLFGSALSCFSDTAFVGEVDRHPMFGRYPKLPEHYRNYCSVCRSHEDYSCPVWRSELPTVPLCSSDALDAYLKLCEECGKNYIIDGSKNADWLLYLASLGLPLDAVKVFIVVRSPFSFVVSNRRALKGFGETSAAWHAEGWRNIYIHSLRTVACLGVPSMILRHEDFARDPATWLRRSAAFLGEEQVGVFDSSFEPGFCHPLGSNLGVVALLPSFRDSGWGLFEESDRELFSSVVTCKDVDVEREGFIISKRTERWSELSEEEMFEILHVPGLIDVANFLGYSFSEFFSKR